MRLSLVFSLMVPVASFVAVSALGVAACAVEETSYVGPEALKGKEPPPPSQPSNGPAADGGGGGVLCNGTPPVPGGPCGKKWKVDIYEPLIKTAWKCTDAICHLEKPDGKAAFLPAINGTDPTRAWNQLAAHTLANKRYVDPCSTDPAVSSITCNLVNPACGVQMPHTGLGLAVTAPTAEHLATLATWLKCGAPNN